MRLHTMLPKVASTAPAKVPLGLSPCRGYTDEEGLVALPHLATSPATTAGGFPPLRNHVNDAK